jgi:hypothetical protein
LDTETQARDRIGRENDLGTNLSPSHTHLAVCGEIRPSGLARAEWS